MRRRDEKDRDARDSIPFRIIGRLQVTRIHHLVHAQHYYEPRSDSIHRSHIGFAPALQGRKKNGKEEINKKARIQADEQNPKKTSANN